MNTFQFSFKLHRITVVFSICFAIFQQIYNLTQPTWLTNDIIDQINRINSFIDDFYYGLSGNGNSKVTELMKLRGGSLLKDIIDRTKHKISCIAAPNDTSCEWINNLKYYAYSAVNIFDVVKKYYGTSMGYCSTSASWRLSTF
jgi:hypothetical protein